VRTVGHNAVVSILFRNTVCLDTDQSIFNSPCTYFMHFGFFSHKFPRSIILHLHLLMPHFLFHLISASTLPCETKSVFA